MVNNSLSLFFKVSQQDIMIDTPELEVESPESYVQTILEFNQQVQNTYNACVGHNVAIGKEQQEQRLNQYNQFYSRNFSQDRIEPQKQLLNGLFKIFSYPLKYLPSAAKKPKKYFTSSQMAMWKGASQLPPELWQHIFSFIPFDSTKEMCQVYTVCRTFFHIFKEPILLKNLLKRYNSCRDSKLFYTILNRSDSSCIQKLTIPQIGLTDARVNILADQRELLENIIIQGGSFKIESFIRLLQSCPNLQTIEFNGMNNPDIDDYFAALAIFAPQIKHIKLVNCCSLSDESLLVIGGCLAQNLQSFEYTNNFRISFLTDYGFVPFLSRCKNLRSLKITGCPQVSQIAPKVFIDQKTQTLQELVFTNNRPVDRALFSSLVTHCPNLTHLELQNFSSFGEDFEDQNALKMVLGSCEKLKSIKFHQESGINQNFLLPLIKRNPLQIKHIDLDQCGIFKLEFFNALAECRNLKSFKFTWTEGVNSLSIDVLKFLKNHNQLEVLCLANNDNFSLTSLHQFIENQKSLKQLQITQCKNINSEILITLAQYSPYLNVVVMDLMNNQGPRIDSEASQFIQNCSDLKFLSLKFPLATTPQLSEKIIIDLAQHGRHLEALMLSHLIIIDEDPKYWKMLYENCPNLTYFGFPNSSMTEAFAVKFLEQFGQQILFLDLQNCEWVTPAFIEKIKELCPYLQTLYAFNLGQATDTEKLAVSLSNLEDSLTHCLAIY